MTTDKERIKQLENELAMRDQTIQTLQKSIDNLTRQVENLTEILIQMRHDKFGPSSEKTAKYDDGSKQMCMFNEVELEADSNVQEPFKHNA